MGHDMGPAIQLLSYELQYRSIVPVNIASIRGITMGMFSVGPLKYKKPTLRI